MKPQDMMLGEISWTQKDKHCLVPLTGGPWRREIHREEVDGGGLGPGEREREMVFNNGPSLPSLPLPHFLILFSMFLKHEQDNTPTSLLEQPLKLLPQ